MKIEFLAMQNCPNVSPMWESLQSAMKELQLNQPIEQLDINTLSERQDKRAGFGSPTILVSKWTSGYQRDCCKIKISYYTSKVMEFM
jgi:hypothetical protein